MRPDALMKCVRDDLVSPFRIDTMTRFGIWTNSVLNQDGWNKPGIDTDQLLHLKF